jgi:hypothetical protein
MKHSRQPSGRQTPFGGRRLIIAEEALILTMLPVARLLGGIGALVSSFELYQPKRNENGSSLGISSIERLNTKV